MADWKIRRRHGECSGCEAPFDDGARHASLLRVDEEEDLLREDLCPACFEAGDPEGYLFWWFTRFHESRTRSLQLDLASLERLFMELDGREETKLRELRYLLCLLLMRKRKLKLQKVERRAEGEVLVLRRPRREEELRVWVFDFTPERIEEMRGRLQEVLEGAGPAPESEAEASEGQEPEGEAPAALAEEGEVPSEGASEGPSEGPSEGVGQADDACLSQA